MLILAKRNLNIVIINFGILLNINFNLKFVKSTLPFRN